MTRTNRKEGQLHRKSTLRRYCWSGGRGFTMFGQYMAAALPRLRTLRAVIPCWWDTGADVHRRIMAKNQDPV